MRSAALALAVGCACGTHRPAPPPVPVPGAAPVIDLAAIDRRIAPCDDFYAFACAGWAEQHPIPPDRARWTRFDALGDHSRAVLRQILVEASSPDGARNELTRQVGDYYASCIDLDRMDALGREPIAADLARIDAIADSEGVIRVLAGLHRKGVGVGFLLYSTRGFTDASRYIAYLDEGELALTREDYASTEPAAADLRRELVAHVARQLERAGRDAADARRDAELVLAIETELAAATMPLADKYDVRNRIHLAATADVARDHPALHLATYLTALGAPAFDQLDVASPAHLAALDHLLATLPVATWKAYLRWHLVREAAPFLGRAFADEDGRFQQQVLAGQPELEPRDQRCTRWVEADLAHPVGQLYVERAFPGDSKDRVRTMVTAIRAALAAEISRVGWMTEPTRREALAKLAAVSERIGYPDRWRDYRSLRIVRGDALGNSLRANEHELQYQLDRIGQPVDLHEWLMPASMANAYYYNAANQIVFPAGILQPPYFDRATDDAANYGAIGFVIGHELTHGFDSSGRSYDGAGTVRDWWLPDDAAGFDARARCFVDQYAGYPATPELAVDGALTLGENIADQGGVRVAHAAMVATGAAARPSRDGFPPVQRFFVAYAQAFCGDTRPEEARRRARTDHHAPGRDRVNGVVSNLAEFADAFACHAGDRMVRDPSCRLW